MPVDTLRTTRRPLVGPSTQPADLAQNRALPTRAPNSSPDLAAFENMPEPQGRHDTEKHLLDQDLLGSFEELQDSKAQQSSRTSDGRRSDRGTDLLGDDSWWTPPPREQVRPPEAESASTHPQPSMPIHITLPPRPSEISADYTPPARPPRRMSRLSSFSGPSSPPLLSDVGHDIIFHPASEVDDSYSTNQSREAVSASSYPHGSPHEKGLQEPQDMYPLHGAAHSRLFNTLSTTTKLASKWKSALDPAVFASPCYSSPSNAQ